MQPKVLKFGGHGVAIGLKSKYDPGPDTVFWSAGGNSYVLVEPGPAGLAARGAEHLAACRHFGLLLDSVAQVNIASTARACKALVLMAIGGDSGRPVIQWVMDYLADGRPAGEELN